MPLAKLFSINVSISELSNMELELLLLAEAACLIFSARDLISSVLSLPSLFVSNKLKSFFNFLLPKSDFLISLLKLSKSISLPLLNFKKLFPSILHVD